MIQSMTGYGKATVVFQDKKITAEIRSLNSKALDLSTRIAPLYREKEMDIRSMISTALERGKVEFSLWIEQGATENDCPLNAALLGKYYQQILAISREQNIPEPSSPWHTLLRMPDVFTRQETQTELSAEEWTAAQEAVSQAIRQLVDFRIQEGAALQKKFEEKLENIATLLKSIEPYEQMRTEKIRQRLSDALATIPNVEYDRNRLEQEMIYYIEKLDINEEKQRLTNHLNYFRQTMNEGHGQGKKLGFIAQEMGREINTTGSKSNQAEMQNIVVKMKDELEQIKEQVLNIM
ncbi:MAG: YicC/YloC family endoribonuclease [Bacteroidaceae bacterium]|nr:YicC family protein [Prevotellaceae bacterium]MDY5631612.1 YicC/YloC family endoribonuclease [Bacteroidaceae bacterium]